jgi:hypothetical protein
MEDARVDDGQPGGVEVEVGRDAHLGAAVVRAIGRAKDVPVEELEIELNDYVDPDALEDVFAPRLDGTPRNGGRLVFSVLDSTVTVTSDRRIRVSQD